MTLNIGDVFVGGTNQRVTVLKVDNDKGIILFILEGSGEPFVVSNEFWVENGQKMRWHKSRYRNDIDSALEIFEELQRK